MQRMEKILMLTFLLYSVPAANACLQCDRTIRVLQDKYVLTASTANTEIDYQNIRDHAHETYREASRNRKGVIDSTTLYQARTEYQNEFNRLLQEFQSTNEPETVKAIQLMNEGKVILEKHLDNFSRDGLCPNKCGLLQRRVIDCMTCRFIKYTCLSPTGKEDCGEYMVQADEEDQVLLDCLLPWHRLLSGKTEYHYSWAPGVPGTQTLNEDDFKPLIVTEESSVVLNQVQVNEQGTYRCSLQDPNGIVYYQVSFLLTVNSLPDETPRPVITLPPLPPLPQEDQSSEDRLVLVVAVVTALILAANMGLTVILGLMINRKMAVKVQRRKEAEENTENTE
ncbi:izumo sperm-egg fusion protein 1 [Antennarius striatus]|uniref:izumo sperm-egg fusion protein 1 n=1 Tax=Antennarius striatus TaxID=241820 RepID=UPI0035AED56F